MVWTGSAQYSFSPALRTLLQQLAVAYPGKGWFSSPQTGTIGDAAHQAENSSSDHNPWLNKMVRALDIAANVSGVPGIVTVTDAPDCEALFAMVNSMYGARDARVWPDGYGIYLRRITDSSRPGKFRTHTGDPHLYHVHISVSRNPAGYNSTAPWPIPGSGKPTPIIADALNGASKEDFMFHLVRNSESGAIRACGPNFWVALEGATPDETKANIALAASLPGCSSKTVENVTEKRMVWLKRFYMTGKVTP